MQPYAAVAPTVVNTVSKTVCTTAIANRIALDPAAAATTATAAAAAATAAAIAAVAIAAATVNHDSPATV